MNRKSLTVLVAIAVIVALLAVLGQRSGQDSASVESRVGDLLLPGLAADLDAIEQVSILRAGNDEAVTLQREGGDWTVDQQDGYPADIGKLREALVALSEARVVEEKTSNPEFYDRLAVEPIELETATGTAVRVSVPGKSYPDVILGGTSGSSSRFVRLADQPTSLLVDRDPSVPTDPTQWLEPELLDVRSDRVQRVEISHADGERVVIEKSGRDDMNFTVADIPAGRELRYATVANVTGNALRELRLQGARALVDTDIEPDVTTEFRTFDGLVVTARIAAIDDDRWVTFSARFDDEQANVYAVEPSGEDAAAETEDDEAERPAEDETGTADVAAEAQAINDRVSGWRFMIPSHIADQMSRRMEDLLREPEPE